MAEFVAPLPKLRFVDNNGNALSGGLLFTYIAGTTTKQTTYTDSTGGTANSNPIVLDSRGECNCWVPVSTLYKFVLSPSTDTDPPTNPIWTVDSVSVFSLGTPVTVANGGTGSSSLTAHAVLLGEGTGALGTATIGNQGRALVDNGSGTDPTFGYPAMRGFIGGLILSNDSGTPNTVLDIAAGQAADNTNKVIMTTAAFTKTTGGAWVAGTGNAGMGNGLTIANSTTYHVIQANNGGTPDFYFDTSASGANRPTGITDTLVRRIGSFLTDSSGHIVPFVQDGDLFQRKTPTTPDSGFSETNPGTSAVTITLASLPSGVNVQALLQIVVAQNDSAGVVYSYFSDLATNDLAPASTFTDLPGTEAAAGGVTVSGGRVTVRTNTSAQIRMRVSFSNGNTTVAGNVLGWIDTRGRYA